MVLRIYKKTIINVFIIKIENDNVKLAFRNSIQDKKPLRLFVNMGDFVIDFWYVYR